MQEYLVQYPPRVLKLRPPMGIVQLEELSMSLRARKGLKETKMKQKKVLETPRNTQEMEHYRHPREHIVILSVLT